MSARPGLPAGGAKPTSGPADPARQHSPPASAWIPHPPAAIGDQMNDINFFGCGDLYTTITGEKSRDHALRHRRSRWFNWDSK